MKALFEGRFEAFATLDVVAEYRLALRSQSVREAAARVGLPAGVAVEYGEALSEMITIVDPGPEFRTADPDDDKFTAASSGAHAEYLVTRDRALLDLGFVLEARVVTPEQFLEAIGL